MKTMHKDEVIQIAGAGPAGLAAAITLAQGGRRVIVHEARATVGARFNGDLQGLENWSTPEDVLDDLGNLGITTGFRRLACHAGTAFDDQGQAYSFQSNQPLFYLVERGPGEDSLDTAMLNQAQALGVEVRFKDRVSRLASPAVLATGPKAADAIAVGYHFDTDKEDGFWVICDDRLAPQGYAYLLVLNGRGTVKTCMFSGFRQEQVHVERTLARFQQLVGFDMRNPRPHGGIGNFHYPATAVSGQRAVVGEQAGFQDTLWGFGMRYAIASGVLAARSLLHGHDYTRLWRASFGRQMQVSMVNRALYASLGNRGYRRFLRHASSRNDVRDFLYRHYRPSWWKYLLLPWARIRYASRRREVNCDHLDCDCVWCRGEEMALRRSAGK